MYIYFAAPVVGKFPWTRWPRGTYGLPMPKQGCPESYKFEWKTGDYRQDTEDLENSNAVTNNSNIAGEVTAGIKLFFYVTQNNMLTGILQGRRLK